MCDLLWSDPEGEVKSSALSLLSDRGVLWLEQVPGRDGPGQVSLGQSRAGLHWHWCLMANGLASSMRSGDEGSWVL